MSATPDPLSVTRDQFTRQASAFAAAPAMRNAEALRLLVSLAETGPEDTVLDVACGPGLVACAFAATARSVTGIDLTPAMIERARAWQQAQGLENLCWHIGTVCPLPFPDQSFTRVVCRYAAHHFEHPGAVLREMTRVCRPGGRVVLADVEVSADQSIAAAFNQMEKLRDPSHLRALSREEMEDQGRACNLELVSRTRYSLPMELDGLLSASFPATGSAEKIRSMITESLVHDRLGVTPCRDGGAIRLFYPIAVLVWRKPIG